MTEQRVLLRGRSEEVSLAGAGEPEFVFANAGATGFYRVAYDAAGLAALVRSLPRLATAERITLLSDEWALVRAGARDIGSFLDLCAGFRREEDHAVLDELVGRLAAIEHRLVAEPDRAALAAFVSGLLAPQLAATGWDRTARGERRGATPAGRRGAWPRARRARPGRRRRGARPARPLAGR